MPEQTVLQALLIKVDNIMMTSVMMVMTTTTVNSGDYLESCLHSFRPSKGSSIYKVASALLSRLHMVEMEMTMMHMVMMEMIMMTHMIMMEMIVMK